MSEERESPRLDQTREQRRAVDGADRTAAPHRIFLCTSKLSSPSSPPSKAPPLTLRRFGCIGWTSSTRQLRGSACPARLLLATLSPNLTLPYPITVSLSSTSTSTLASPSARRATPVCSARNHQFQPRVDQASQTRRQRPTAPDRTVLHRTTPHRTSPLCLDRWLLGLHPRLALPCLALPCLASSRLAAGFPLLRWASKQDKAAVTTRAPTSTNPIPPLISGYPAPRPAHRA